MDEDARCSSCVYCESITVRGHETGRGKCRRRTPTASGSVGGRAAWPVVNTDEDWCAEWSDGAEDDLKIGGTE